MPRNTPPNQAADRARKLAAIFEEPDDIQTPPVIEELEPDEEESVGVPGTRKFKVEIGRHLHWHGALAFFPAGEVLDEGQYDGPPGIAKLQEMGLKLTQVES